MSNGLRAEHVGHVKKLMDEQSDLRKCIEDKTQKCGELCIIINGLPDSILKIGLLSQLDECIVHVHALMQHNKRLEVELNNLQSELDTEQESTK